MWKWKNPYSQECLNAIGGREKGRGASYEEDVEDAEEEDVDKKDWR